MSTSKKYFGTDGIRGRVGQYPITPELVLKLGRAAGYEFSTTNHNQVVIGHDGRRSAEMLQAALVAGLTSAGVDCLLLGMIPTPTVAFLTRHHKAQAGIVISASHNPYQDNGIKFFNSQGGKLPDQVELNIEHALKHEAKLVDVDYLGQAKRINNAHHPYQQFTTQLMDHTDMSPYKIILDCANGATSTLAPAIFQQANIEVIVINDEPNGVNINHHCGSTHITTLQETVTQQQAHLGIAFDGDGDRVLMVDEKGECVDGDEIVYILAQHAKLQGQFTGGVVGTQMSNFGLEQALQGLDIPFLRTHVGDRYILSALNEHGWQIGGEASGHIMCLQDTTTGDGTITAIRVLQAMQQTHQTLHQLKKGMHKHPQILINVPLNRDYDIMNCPTIRAAIKLAEERLANRGRVLIRKSGTEPVVRVMVEGEQADLLEELASQLADVVRRQV